MTFKYKGYLGAITHIDEEANLMHGELIGINDVVTFQGSSVEEIKQAFHDSVDDYLNFCKDRGEEPDKVYSGKINLRMEPGLHAKLAFMAARRGVSLNTFINEKLSD